MAAYVIGAIFDVTDPAGFEEYAQKAVPTIAKYGGKPVLTSQKVEVADGSWSPKGIVVFEFESLERVKEWYNSEDYAAAKPLRAKSSDTGMIFADIE